MEGFTPVASLLGGMLIGLSAAALLLFNGKVAGISGILLGSAIAYSIGAIYEWSIRVSINSIFLSFGFSTAVGILFGLWPAQKAAKLDPITALRYE